MTDIICAVVSGLTAIFVAIIAKRTKDKETATEKRAARRREESMLSLDMMSATMNLTMVCANALTGGHNNGNVEDAKKEVERSRKEYTDFLKKLEAEELWGKVV